MLVSRFFRVYNLWRWPNPVMLCPIQEGSLGLSFWDPRRNYKDRLHLMPIITPAYPCMNSSYNVSTSTLRVMMEEFQRGNETCKEIEGNKATWDVLFEPFAFFEAYRNYLQIDIAAEADDDSRNWKGWVKSRIRLLTLKIERVTNGVLQCHPYPGDFSEKSKPFHHSYFMGLRRKQGSNPQEGQQFDIRTTVEDFKRDVYAYSFWKPTMWINVCHMKQKEIPSFVFPDGVRPVSKSQSDLGTTRKKRKQDQVNKGVSLTESSSPSVYNSEEATVLDDTVANKKQISEFDNKQISLSGQLLSFSAPSTGSLATENPGNEQSSVPAINRQGSTDVINGLLEVKSEPIESEADNHCSENPQSAELEELEPLELPATTNMPSTSADVPVQKPMIRFSFTSLARETNGT